MADGRYVLVVDDDREVRDVLVVILAERHTVRAVGSGEEALELCAVRAPDAIVLDLLSRSEVGGFDTVERLRAAGCASPVVVLSAAPVSELARAARLPGVVAAVPKPFEIDDLVAAVERALGRA